MRDASRGLIALLVAFAFVMTAAVTRDLIQRGIKAGDCIKVAAKVVGGGGGGRADMAEAGGRFPEKLPEALEAGAAYYREKLSAK